MNYNMIIADRDGTILYEGPMPMVEWSYSWRNERQPWFLRNIPRPRGMNIMRRKLRRLVAKEARP